MLRATFKSLLSRKLRLILSGLAVVLGVMSVSGSLVLTDTLGRSFDNLFAGVYEHVDVGVQAKPKVGSVNSGLSFFPASVVEQVRKVPGVKRVTADASADRARVIGSDGKVVASSGAPRYGTNWTGEDELIQLRSGRGPSADDEIAVNASLAKAAKIKIGDLVTVRTLQPGKQFKLVGIVGYSGDRDTLGGATQVFFTDRVAQELLLGQRDSYSSLTVRADSGVSAPVLRERISKELGAGYEVKTGKQLTDDASAGFKQFLKFFNYVLLGFAGVALFVGIFLILNTFSIIIAQRTRELALMRAVGASRGQMIGSVLIEAVVIGLIASVLGLGAGVGVGALLAKLIASAGDSGLALASIGVPTSAIISSFMVGILVTVVAATFPAVRASRVPPIAALQESATPDRPLTKITVFGAIVAAIGGTALTLGLTGAGDTSTTLWLILAGVLICFIAVALLAPVVARPAVSVIGRPLSWSITGKLGRLNSGRNPRRTAITASALMIGLALITGVNVILASTVQSMHKILDSSFSANFIISGEANDSGDVPTFSPASLDRIKQVSGVRSVVGEYFDHAMINNDETYVSAVTDLRDYAKVLSLKAKSGSLETLGPNQAVVGEKMASKHNLHVGDSVRVQLPRGEAKSMTLVGIYAKSDLSQGWLLSKESAADFTTQQVAWGYVTLADGASPDSVRKQISPLIDNPEVTVTDRTDYIDKQEDQLNNILTWIQALLAMAIIISILGVINTLALSVLERTRELGLLRAIGMRRAQAMRMVGVESIVISLFGAALGIVVGCGLGAAVVKALHSEGITELAFPFARLGVYLGLAALVGIVAAILPAIRTARINVLNAIAYE